MSKKIIIILINIFSISLYAQTKCIGTVKTEYEEFIPKASVIIKDTGGHITGFGFTDDKGFFDLNTENEGDFIVEIHKAGFINEQQNLIINKNTKIYKLDFVLEESSELLDDLVIDIDAPIRKRGDTISYDAKAFTTGREQTVEDLLKNIPGIVVEKDGKVKFNDIEIEKVTVENDDLFNQGYTLLTKNMPNIPLNKVQVLTNYSNNKLLKGVEESNKVAINLTIDEEYKNIWFGDLSLGYGLVTENKYDVTGNLMNFSTKYKSFLNFSLNNVGIDRVGSINDMFYNNNEIESIRNKELSPLMVLNGARAGQLKDYRTRINNAEHVALSTITPITKKVKIKTVGFLGFDENYAFNHRFSVTSVGTTYFENNETNQFKSHLKKFYINLLATYDISKTQMVEINSIWNKGNTKNYNNLTFNSINTNELLKTNSTFLDQKATYTHKWKDKNALLLKARYFTNKIPQFYDIDDYLMDDLFDFNADSMNNDIKNEKTFAGLEADFKIRQKNKDLIEFQIGYQHNIESINTVFQLFNKDNSILPNNFQTDSSFNMGDLYARTSYTWKWTNFAISGRAEAHQLFNKFKSLNSNKSQNPFYINPAVDFIWEISPTQKIIGGYLINFMNVSKVNVNDTYILNSSRSFSKGFGDFRITDFQTANLTYSIQEYLSRYRFSFGINYRKQNNIISSRTILEQNSSLSENIIIKGGDALSFNFNSNFYLRNFFKSTIKLTAQYLTTIYYNEINSSELRKINNYSQNYNLEWSTGYKEGFNFLLGSELYINKVKSPDFQSNYNNIFNFMEFYYTSKGVNLKAVSEHYYFGNLNINKRNHYFIDFESSYTIKEKYIISLRANNILNKKNFTTYNISDIGYSTTSYSLLSRFILLSFKFRF